jgi:hypothetical protein
MSRSRVPNATRARPLAEYYLAEGNDDGSVINLRASSVAAFST